MPVAPVTLLPLLLVAQAAATTTVADAGSRLDRWLQRAGFQGSALVAKADEVLLRKGYGMSDREAGVPYDAETVFSLGSITKQFTAAAILKLEMQGKLRVEDKIARFLSGVPADKQGITIHQLLTHTSGLDSDFAGDFDPVGRDAYVERALLSTLLSRPGTANHYSNAGYSLLGAIVELASGQPYELFLRDNLFLPAGMERTGYRLAKWDPKRIAVGYRDGRRWGRLTEKPWAQDGPHWALRANGAIHTTLDDVLKWHRALRGDALLSAPQKAQMFARHVAEEAGDSFYGYGWAVREAPEAGRIVSHNGGNGIFYAEVIRFLDADTLVAVSTNDSTIRGGRIAEGLARMTLGGPEPPVPEKRGAGAHAVSTSPLGTEGRDATVRAWLDAFNAPGFEAMHAFRRQHAVPRPGVDEAERDRQLERLRRDLGRLDVVAVTSRGEQDVTVRAGGPQGGAATFRFVFTPEGKVEGVGVEIGR